MNNFYENAECIMSNGKNESIMINDSAYRVLRGRKGRDQAWKVGVNRIIKSCLPTSCSNPVDECTYSCTYKCIYRC